ncbi:MAG: o-succinylbenzoate synthase [Bacteroidota bacterium]
MLTATYKKHTLFFRKPAGTSRGILQAKNSYFIFISDTHLPGITGVGECSIIPGLSPDDRPELEEMLSHVIIDISLTWENRNEIRASWPGIITGIEMAMTDLKNGGIRVLFPSPFTEGNHAIPIHGLIWMGNTATMLQQIDEKLNNGFKVIKMKIGTLAFEEELNLIKYIRQHFNNREIEIRLDANEAFSLSEALEKMKRLAEFSIHSVEQPIRRGQPEAMAELCRKSPVPIALDEELIGLSDDSAKLRLLEMIRPHYIIIKPSLLGGFESSDLWIKQAEKVGSGWWITSALESDIGLNAIAQWTITLDNPLVQGLGTGSLFKNNIPSPLMVLNGGLCYNTGKTWDFSSIV